MNSNGQSGGSWVLPVATLVVGVFMSVLDLSIVNIAIPSIQMDFGSSREDIEWVTTVYSLTEGVLVPASAWLGDRYGRSRVYAVCLGCFVFCSGLCALSWNLPSLVIFRLAQAIPGGILLVVTLSMVYSIVPSDSIGSAMGLYGVGVVVAPAVGPILGGWLVEYFNWRLIFFLNVPIGLIGLALCVFVPHFPKGVPRLFDTRGFVCASGGLFSLLLAFSESQSWGWTSYRVLILLTAGMLSLAAFVLFELESPAPLIDLRVLIQGPFTTSLVLIGILAVGLYSVLFYIPLFLQEGLGAEPLTAGLVLLPEAIVMGFTMAAGGLLYDLIGPRVPATFGLILTAWGTYSLCRVNVDVPLSDVVLWTGIRGAGNGLAMMSVVTSGIASVRSDRLAEAVALNNIAQRVSSALGLAIITSLISHEQSQLLADNGALVRAVNPSSSVEIKSFARGGLTMLLALYERLQVMATAGALSDAFLLLSILTCLGAVMAIFVGESSSVGSGDRESSSLDTVASSRSLAITRSKNRSETQVL